MIQFDSESANIIMIVGVLMIGIAMIWLLFNLD